jgi:dTDP-4-dehydrorhamnose reductase
MPDLPISTVEDLEERLSRPCPAVTGTLAALRGDIVVLGAGGKMGPSLARMARRALDAATSRQRVIAVARFSDARVRHRLEKSGVETIACDLVERREVDRLPEARAVIFMVGAKFGTTAAAAATWAANCHAASLAAERYAGVPTVVFSTGNVYPFVAIESDGATEDTPLAPLGEYAQSALGRERIFEFFANSRVTPVAIIRLNYAVELRYGVLADVARKVWTGAPVDLRMGFVNCIWQSDANAAALRSLAAVRSPPFVLNVTGVETVSVRAVAERFGEIFGRAPIVSGSEEPTALLSNAALAADRFGPPSVPLATAIEWVAHWIEIGGESLNKPTHFETRDGRF